MIRQFDVVPNPIRSGREEKPYLICIQHRLLDHLATRVMLPLLARPIGGPPRLHPALAFDAGTYFLDPAEPVTVLARRMRTPIANLAAERDRILAALDLVFTGV